MSNTHETTAQAAQPQSSPAAESQTQAPRVFSTGKVRTGVRAGFKQGNDMVVRFGSGTTKL